jgi:hypothetical protein
MSRNRFACADGSRAPGVLLLLVLLLAAAACDEASDAPDVSRLDASSDVASDAHGDDAATPTDGDDLGDRLLCEVMCARQERSRCALFDADACVAACVASVRGDSARCRPEIEQWVRCRASGASYVCDDRGQPTTLECSAETAALARCRGDVDRDAGDATAPDDAGDATAPDDADDVTDIGDDVDDADDAADAGDVLDAEDIADTDDVTDPSDVADKRDAAGAADASIAPDAADGGLSDPCATPVGTITMPGATVARDATTAGRSTIAASLCAPDTTGPEHVWHLSVSARTGVVIDTEGTRGFDTALSVRRTCGDIRTETLCDDDSGRDNTALLRAMLDPGDYALIVDGRSAMAGTYSLRARAFTPASNAACAGALPLAPGAAITNQNVFNGGLRGDHCRASASGGPLFYSVVVPGMNRVTVRATPTGATPWAPALAAVTSCAAAACAAQSAGEAPGVASTLALLNTSASPVTYLVSAANLSGADGTFDLSASAPLSTVAGSTCPTALLLAPGTPRVNQDLAGAFQNGAALCLSGLAGPQLYYVLRVPSRQRGTVTVTPRAATPMAPVLRVLRACAATSCESSAQAPSGAPAALSFDNPDAVSVDVVVAVSNALGAGGSFDVSSTLGAIPAGVTCAGPTALTVDVVSSANTLNGTVSGASTCEPDVPGPQLFYTLRIPAGRRATVLATPTGASPWRPTLRALDTCAAPLCAQYATAPAAGAPASLAIDNTTAAERVVVFTVAGAGLAPGGPVDVRATLSAAAPSPYVVSMIPVACDAMPASALVAPAEGWDDDSATAPIALPFPLRFFAASPTHFAVCSNGFVELLDAGMVTPSIADVNVAMPNNRAPNGLVAPFWDDLAPVDETSDVRVATLGRAPARRLVVQWTNWQVIGDTASRLVFQTKLFEGTNVIEHHYCAATPARALPLGASATIGVESLDGASAVGIAHNRFNAVDPANAYRLAPR